MKEYYAIITDTNPENFPRNWSNEKIREVGKPLGIDIDESSDWSKDLNLTEGLIAHLVYINYEEVS